MSIALGLTCTRSHLHITMHNTMLVHILQGLEHAVAKFRKAAVLLDGCPCHVNLVESPAQRIRFRD